MCLTGSLRLRCMETELPKMWEEGGGTNPALAPDESDALLGALVFPLWPPADLQTVIP